MLSKEKIEKAKDDLIFFNEGDYITREMDESADILEEYIKELELSNTELDKENNRFEKIELERDKANNKIKKLKDKMQADRMKEFDNYVIHLIDSYLEIIGGENE